MQPRSITTGGRPLAGGRVPAICAPLVGRTPDQLAAEAAAVVLKQPDLLEWRVDFFGPIADTAAVLAAGAQLRRAAGRIPSMSTAALR